MKLNRLMLAAVLSLSLSATSAYACENGGHGDQDHSWASFWHRCFHGQDDDRNHDGDHDRNSDHSGGGCNGGSGSGGSTSSGGGTSSGGTGSTSGTGNPYK